jgi:cellulose 1,4-beta-cellobiosidase
MSVLPTKDKPMKRFKEIDWHRLATRTGVMALLATGVVAMAEPAHAAAGCQIVYAMTPQLGFVRADVQIMNTGDPITNGWTLEFDFPAGQRLIDGWPVTWTQQPGTNHVAATSNATWNHTLPTGVWFPTGFNFTGLLQPPTRFTLNGTDCGGTPPTLTVTSPTLLQTFPAGAVVPAAATATDPDPQGAITRVDFRVDNLLTFPNSPAPYGVKFSNLPSGLHNLTLTAIDNGNPPKTTTVTVPFRIG